MISRTLKPLVALLAALALPAATALAAPTPTTAKGKKLQRVVSGLHTPTAFAFGGGHTFAAAGGPPSAKLAGGVFLIENGRAHLLPGSPAHVFGLAWHNGTLYLSARSQLLAWGGFNGMGFDTRRVIYTAPPGFSDFNGIGFGADGRLYAGVSVGLTDSGPSPTPFARDILSFNSSGGDLRVVATGIRQPWQFAFPPRSSSPFVTSLGQDFNASNPPDFVLRVRPGQRYGFNRGCSWMVPADCSRYARPYWFFPAHADPMGIGIIGKRLYLSEFGEVLPPQVVSIPMKGGGKPRVEARGFGGLIVGLGTNDGWVYVGGLDGQVWRFRP